MPYYLLVVFTSCMHNYFLLYVLLSMDSYGAKPWKQLAVYDILK